MTTPSPIIAFFRERLDAAAGGPPPPLGLHLLMGANARLKFQNMLANLERGAIARVLMLARRCASAAAGPEAAAA